MDLWRETDSGKVGRALRGAFSNDFVRMDLRRRSGGSGPRLALIAGCGSDVVEDLPLRRPHSVVAVVGHPLAASRQFQMATNTRATSVSSRCALGGKTSGARERPASTCGTRPVATETGPSSEHHLFGADAGPAGEETRRLPDLRVGALIGV